MLSRKNKLAEGLTGLRLSSENCFVTRYGFVKELSICRVNPQSEFGASGQMTAKLLLHITARQYGEVVLPDDSTGQSRVLGMVL